MLRVVVVTGSDVVVVVARTVVVVEPGSPMVVVVCEPGADVLVVPDPEPMTVVCVWPPCPTGVDPMVEDVLLNPWLVEVVVDRDCPLELVPFESWCATRTAATTTITATKVR